MIDCRIENGDISVDSTGRFVRITEKEALFQRVMICISARLGEFVYDRGLGSRRDKIERNGINDSQRLELVLNEALARFENTYVTVLEFSEKIKVKICIDGECRTEEVYMLGNL
ncbi:MAG: hypothetical protein J1E85_06830 [Ruminococcus sp.]|nr:hypothetical protein [Ruminococcus sp.]